MTPTMSPPVFRFAPSPNGELHLGHALSALVGWERARACGGRFLLRIEDIDTGRSRPQFVAGILADLAWLGIAWEEPVVFQSQRLSAYRAAAARLEQMGLTYPCFATRAEIEPPPRAERATPTARRSIPGSTRAATPSEIARRRAAGEAFALRIDMEAAIAAAAAKLGGAPLDFTELAEDGTPQTIEARPERWGDAVIVRKDVPASYHLAVVVDDAWQGVTHVTRGRDLYPRDRPAPPAAGAARPAGARLSPPPADHRRTRAASSPRAPATRACDPCAKAATAPADIRRLVVLRLSSAPKFQHRLPAILERDCGGVREWVCGCG